MLSYQVFGTAKTTMVCVFQEKIKYEGDFYVQSRFNSSLQSCEICVCVQAYKKTVQSS